MQLNDVVLDLKGEVEGIRQHFARVPSGVRVPNRLMEYIPTSDGCVVSLWDAWTRFMRKLVLTCASSTVTGLNGNNWMPAKERDEEAALKHLKCAQSKGAVFNLSYGEPIWNSARDIEHVANALGLQNSTNFAATGSSMVTLALGLSVPNPISEIRDVRNYIAHKTPRNKATVLNHCAFTRTTSIEDHLRSTSMGGATHFDDWIDGLMGIAEAVSD